MALNSPRRRRNLKYRDISLNLNVNPLSNDIATLSDEQSIQQSVKLLVMTKFYEKWFKPDIGNFIPEALFELPSDQIADEIRRTVAAILTQYEPRIVLQNGEDDILVDDLEDDRNEFKVQIRYLIKGQIGQTVTEVYVQRTK